ncbi:ORF2 [Lepus torque teno virus 1]|uniref:ORF2 n=1 Tax=Lepus torque teno virus 1 TaxID=2716318 RepID=A0A6G7NP48_9VIRU|nr:ORF2 [Lepus torque teno virus 1]QIJ55524.1 ORF2 [Lepus torque teno virus 1]
MSDFNLCLEDEGLKRTISEEHWLLAVISSHNAFCTCGSWSEHLRNISPSLRTQAASFQRCGTPDGDADGAGGGDSGDGPIVDDVLLAAALEEAEAKDAEDAAG